MQPRILWDQSAQDEVITELRPLAMADTSPFSPIGRDGQLLYLPGRIYPQMGMDWQRLAQKSKGPRGFSAADLAKVLSRSPSKPQRSLRSGRGFVEAAT
jgi:hypothetical protein